MRLVWERMKIIVEPSAAVVVAAALAHPAELAGKRVKCPKCGSQLAKRLGRNGSFIGCTNYPECDYTRNLDDDGSAGGLAKQCRHLSLISHAQQPILDALWMKHVLAGFIDGPRRLGSNNKGF